MQIKASSRHGVSSHLWSGSPSRIQFGPYRDMWRRKAKKRTFEHPLCRPLAESIVFPEHEPKDFESRRSMDEKQKSPNYHWTSTLHVRCRGPSGLRYSAKNSNIVCPYHL